MTDLHKEVKDVPETKTKRPGFALPKSLHKDCISKQKVKELIKLEQKLILSLATRKQILANPINKKIRKKLKEMEL